MTKLLVVVGAAYASLIAAAIILVAILWLWGKFLKLLDRLFERPVQ